MPAKPRDFAAYWVASGAHTAAGAAALTHATAVSQGKTDATPASAVVFCAVLTFYAAAALMRSCERPDPRADRLRRHLRPTLALIPIAFLTGLVLTPFCDVARILNLALVIALGIAYRVPLPGLGWRRFGPGKPFLLAIAWTLLTTPCDGGDPLPQILRLASLSALCVLFDIKDLNEDRNHGIRTPAVLLGAHGARALSTGLFAFAAALAYERRDMAALAETLVLAGVATAGMRGNNRLRIIFYGDGAMILAGVVHLLVHSHTAA